MATQEAKSTKLITNFYNCFSLGVQSIQFQFISGLAFYVAGHKLSFSFKQLNLLHSECPKPRLPYIPPPLSLSLSLSLSVSVTSWRVILMTSSNGDKLKCWTRTWTDIVWDRYSPLNNDLMDSAEYSGILCVDWDSYLVWVSEVVTGYLICWC